ncbi:carbonic anhydrase family protein [Hahella aquimaris]|uniref:carbonic anhydrase n=1 Tax=Hahella sp. HNIBRBA332 TaxID=3015983 RepID=UPI00273CED71|nr:carbonic anhydrase family protein [Hahella sp. HNIBRBA332]WLQ12426.1 carbonic anhydrase family protein [Hahella sp. HNIBRBA332]
MIRRLIWVVAGVTACGHALASGESHWGYDKPERWGELKPEYTMCSAGKNQSPVDISGLIKGDLPAVGMSYSSGGHEVVNNGHTIQVNYKPGSKASVEGREFELKQFHFHAPSENTVDGKSFPLEAHFVHANENGELAVLSVLYEEGDHNEHLAKVWEHMPKEAGDANALPTSVNAGDMVSANSGYYRFNGSLTTPPCSEGVRWLVMKEHRTASKEQINQFMETMGGPTNRPVQGMNARIILH